MMERLPGFWIGEMVHLIKGAYFQVQLTRVQSLGPHDRERRAILAVILPLSICIHAFT